MDIVPSVVPRPGIGLGWFVDAVGGFRGSDGLATAWCGGGCDCDVGVEEYVGFGFVVAA